MSASVNMDGHASSSPSHPKTPTDATSTKKEVSSASVEQTSNTWIKDMEGGILKACANWKRAEFCTSVFPNNIARYDANEGTEKDLTHALVSIYLCNGEESTLTISSGPHLQEIRALKVAL